MYNCFKNYFIGKSVSFNPFTIDFPIREIIPAVGKQLAAIIYLMQNSPSPERPGLFCLTGIAAFLFAAFLYLPIPHRFLFLLKKLHMTSFISISEVVLPKG